MGETSPFYVVSRVRYGLKMDMVRGLLAIKPLGRFFFLPCHSMSHKEPISGLEGIKDV